MNKTRRWPLSKPRDLSRVKEIEQKYKKLGRDRRNCLNSFDFSNQEVGDLLTEIFEARMEISALERKLDPEEEWQKSMKIITDAAKYLESSKDKINHEQ
jgi:lipoate-protein ligase A